MVKCALFEVVWRNNRNKRVTTRLYAKNKSHADSVLFSNKKTADDIISIRHLIGYDCLKKDIGKIKR